jgi:beta-xylosidase
MPDAWSIAIYRGPSPLALAPTGAVITAADVTDVDAAAAADPFLLRRNGRWFLFFEVIPRANHRGGVIALAESNDAVHWRYRGVVLREPFHLSYPHVFESDGATYMTPENANGVRLYRCSSFPNTWTYESDLLSIGAADPTPFRVDGRWWMFVCTPPYTLRLFFSESLTGPYREHPSSPITRDDTCARPAGRVVMHDGALLRFAQVGRPAYGSAVRAFRITELTSSSYREEEASTSPVLTNGHHIDAQRLEDGSWIAAVDGRGNGFTHRNQK